MKRVRAAVSVILCAAAIVNAAPAAAGAAPPPPLAVPSAGTGGLAAAAERAVPFSVPGIGASGRLAAADGRLLVWVDVKEAPPILARETLDGSSLWLDDAAIVDLRCGTNTLRVIANPLGAVSCEANGRNSDRLLRTEAVRASARFDATGWHVVLSLPLPGPAPDLGARVAYQRQQRGLQPPREAFWPESGEFVPLQLAPATGIDPALPARHPEWDRPPCPALRTAAAPTVAEWAAAPAVRLNSDDRLLAEFQPTVLRGVLTPDALLLRVRGDEAWAGAQDAIAVFVGPQGSPYLALERAPDGKSSAVQGRTGGRSPKSAAVPSGVRVDAEPAANGSWELTFTIPVAAVMEFAGAPASHTPDAWPWLVQVTRERAGRPEFGQAMQFSWLAPHGANTHAPARFARLQAASRWEPQADEPDPRTRLPPPVLDADQRALMNPSAMLSRTLQARRQALEAAAKRQAAMLGDSTNPLRAALRADLHKRYLHCLFPAGEQPPRAAGTPVTVYDRPRDGFRIQGVILPAIQGLPCPVTVYLPDPATGGVQRAALVMIPAHHTGRQQRDLQMLGANFARAGGIAVAFDAIGSGERGTIGAWEHISYQRAQVAMQAMLAGDEVTGWSAFELSRVADYLIARGDIDPARLAIVGAVAGGGDFAAEAGAFDDRWALTIPFNFESVGLFGGYYDTPRALPGSHTAGLSPWAIDALVAPRKLLQATEFAWGERQREAYDGFTRVWGAAGAGANLAFLHGGPNTHATHFAQLHRMPMYRIVGDWFGMPLPQTNTAEYTRFVDWPELNCGFPEAGWKWMEAQKAAGALREPYELAARAADARLARARASRSSPAAVAASLAGQVLDVRVPPTSATETGAPFMLGGLAAHCARVWLQLPEAADVMAPSAGLALWLLAPAPEAGASARLPAVLCLAQTGKAAFLETRAAEIAALLRAGVAVAILDWLGTGETGMGGDRFASADAATLASVAWMQSDSLPARRVRETRAALVYLASQRTVDASRLALWGEGLTPVNGRDGEAFRFEESPFRQASPLSLRLAEPAGGMIAMLAALWPVENATGKASPVRAVLARGTLVSFRSMLDGPYYYVPYDCLVPRLLTTADMSDVASALRGTGVTLLAEDLRDASNRVQSRERVAAAWGSATPADYSASPTAGAVDALAASLTGK